MKKWEKRKAELAKIRKNDTFFKKNARALAYVKKKL
jgi:hypothetical protein